MSLSKFNQNNHRIEKLHSKCFSCISKNSKNSSNSSNFKLYYNEEKKLIRKFYYASNKGFSYNDIDFTKDYYKTLGVQKTANEKEIKTAYFKLARQHHPDLTGGKSTEKFKEITAAYEVLSNKDKRAMYDSSNSPFGSFKNPFKGYKSQDFNSQKTDNNYNANAYKSNDNFYSNFENFANSFKNSNFYKEYNETYTFKDGKTGEYKTYHYKTKNNENPFYQDFDELLRKRRKQSAQRKRNEEFWDNQTNSSFNNRSGFQQDSHFSNNKNPFNEFNNSNNFNRFNDPFQFQNQIRRYEIARLITIIFISSCFVLWYSHMIRRRRMSYSEREYRDFMNSNQGDTYYEPINSYDTPKFHTHNTYQPSQSYLHTPRRSYFTNDEVPPYK